MPALAPVESPDELDESVGVSEDVAVAAAVVVVAVFDTGVEAGGVLESLACHRIYTPYALMWSELLSAVSALDVDPSSSVQVYVNWVVRSPPGDHMQSMDSEMVEDSAGRVSYVWPSNL